MKGATFSLHIFRLALIVSIHAPVKGATGVPAGSICVLPVSIHAPVKGATSFSLQEGALQRVSIHAPVKGATTLKEFKGYVDSGFNPRTREGCDYAILAGIGAYFGFQSTHP